MGTKTAVSFANIFMAEIETNLMQQNNTKPREWKRYIDDVFSLWDCNRNEVERFIEQANTFHPTIKFTDEISENEIIFLDTVVFRGERFIKESILDIKTHYNPTETFQYTHFTSCHPPGVKRGFIKGEAIRLLRTNSSKTTFEECLTNFKRRLEARGYPKNYIESSLSEVTFDSRQSALNPHVEAQSVERRRSNPRSNIFSSHGLLPSDLVAQSVERRRSNPKVVASIPNLVRVFLCPCVGPFPSVGLTLTWFIWDRNLALHITLYSVNSV